MQPPDGGRGILVEPQHMWNTTSHLTRYGCSVCGDFLAMWNTESCTKHKRICKACAGDGYTFCRGSRAKIVSTQQEWGTCTEAAPTNALERLKAQADVAGTNYTAAGCWNAKGEWYCANCAQENHSIWAVRNHQQDGITDVATAMNDRANPPFDNANFWDAIEAYERDIAVNPLVAWEFPEAIPRHGWPEQHIFRDDSRAFGLGGVPPNVEFPPQRRVRNPYAPGGGDNAPGAPSEPRRAQPTPPADRQAAAPPTQLALPPPPAGSPAAAQPALPSPQATSEASAAVACASGKAVLASQAAAEAARRAAAAKARQAAAGSAPAPRPLAPPVPVQATAAASAPPRQNPVGCFTVPSSSSASGSAPAQGAGSSSGPARPTYSQIPPALPFPGPAPGGGLFGARPPSGVFGGAPASSSASSGSPPAGASSAVAAPASGVPPGAAAKRPTPSTFAESVADMAAMDATSTGATAFFSRDEFPAPSTDGPVKHRDGSRKRIEAPRDTEHGRSKSRPRDPKRQALSGADRAVAESARARA